MLDKRAGKVLRVVGAVGGDKVTHLGSAVGDDKDVVKAAREGKVGDVVPGN